MEVIKIMDSDENRQILEWAEAIEETTKVENELYTRYEVKRGLRNRDGRGVLAGLTRIGEIRAYLLDEGELIPKDGELIYRGIQLSDLVGGFLADKRFGFEETTYLLNFGRLPNRQELDDFNRLLSKYRQLPEEFVRDSIMKAPSKDMMNTLARSVLTLYSFDERADDTDIPNLLRQGLQLIAIFPLLAVYGYQAYCHYHGNASLFIHKPKQGLSTAENILHMLRIDNQYTPLEARLLDLALVLHAEHGGGNNSAFTTHVVSSTGTDTYSVIAAALGSLKGPRHGGANIKVKQMFSQMKEEINDWQDEEAVSHYLQGILDGQRFDQTGLIYGIGHAVYTKSDPRAVVFKDYVEALAKEKGRQEEYKLYQMVERLAPKLIAEKYQTKRIISANVDFYSGFVYEMMSIPEELYTPLFAVARISGWIAHRIEEIVNRGKIIRPAYKSVERRKDYIALDDRN